MRSIFLTTLAFLLICSTAMANPPTLHPRFPVVNGTYQLTKEWAIALPQPHNRRIDDGAMVLWRPAFTVRLYIWDNSKSESIEQRYAWWRSRISPDATEVIERLGEKPPRFSYRLDEARDEGIVYELHGFVIGPDSHVQASIYFDSPAQIDEARNVFGSIALSPLVSANDPR